MSLSELQEHSSQNMNCYANPALGYAWCGLQYLSCPKGESSDISKAGYFRASVSTVTYIGMKMRKQ